MLKGGKKNHEGRDEDGNIASATGSVEGIPLQSRLPAGRGCAWRRGPGDLMALCPAAVAGMALL